MTKTIFITGAEGTGKTSLLPYLKKDLNFEIHDFDEVGVPSNPPLQWRLDTTKYWLKIANENKKKGKNTLIAGLIFPEEVERYDEYGSLNIEFILLDISKEERKKRLVKRKSEQELIEESERINELKKQFEKTKFKTNIINVNSKTIEETAEEIIKLFG